jgi:type VI protein secretion system component VasK
MDTGDTTKYMMSIGLIVVGALCGALYLYVEKAIPKTDEEKKEEVKTEEEKPKEEEKKEEVKTEEPKVEEKKESPKE